MAKLMSLEAWAAAKYDKPPHMNTLRKWARDGLIYPVPKKQGRGYVVREDAEYSDYRQPAPKAAGKPAGKAQSLVERISG